MATCELCGAAGNVTRVEIESAQVKACKDCANMETQGSTPVSSEDAGRDETHATGSDAVLTAGYGEMVRVAREEQGFSQEDLADELNVKQSVLRRVENEELTPDRDLAAVLEQELGITLYTAEEPVPTQSGDTGSSDGGATLGDVADIRNT